jgi:hypothetical protein
MKQLLAASKYLLSSAVFPGVVWDGDILGYDAIIDLGCMYHFRLNGLADLFNHNRIPSPIKLSNYLKHSFSMTENSEKSALQLQLRSGLRGQISTISGPSLPMPTLAMEDLLPS